MKVIGVAGQCCAGKDVFADTLCEILNLRCDELFLKEYRNSIEVLGNVWKDLDTYSQASDREVKDGFRHSGGYWQRSAFATAVKKIFCDAFGKDNDFIEQWKRSPESPPEFLKPVRQALQFIGDGFRSIKDDIWIDVALRDENKKLVISDSRYFNEAEAIKKKGGMMVLLYRPGFENSDPNPSESQIKKVVDWCVNTAQKEGVIHDWDKWGHSYSIPEMQHYDFFIRNDGSVENLREKIIEYVVPHIIQKYRY